MGLQAEEGGPAAAVEPKGENRLRSFGVSLILTDRSKSCLRHSSRTEAMAAAAALLFVPFKKGNLKRGAEEKLRKSLNRETEPSLHWPGSCMLQLYTSLLYVLPFGTKYESGCNLNI